MSRVLARLSLWLLPCQVADAPGETWMAVNLALWQGLRGLPGGWSLARLLKGGQRRGRPLSVGRRRRATALREQGLTLAEIGRRLGITPQAVHQLLDGRTTS